MVKECPRIYNIAYVLPKDSVFANRINEILLRLLNGGLINQWIKDMKFNITLDNIRIYGPSQEQNFKILTVIDLQLAFFILVFGSFISFGIFLVEKFYF
jgi:hypothetical protein